MKERAVAMEKTRSLENLHELRLMALLLDVIREKGRMEAADLLGVDPRTVKACLEQGALSKWMRTALEAQRMGALEQQITSGLGEMRTTMGGQIKGLKDEHAGALRQWERRLA